MYIKLNLFDCFNFYKYTFWSTTAAFKLAPIKSATNLQFSAGLFVNAKKVQFVLVKVPINRDKTAPAPDLIGRLNSAL